MEEGVGVEKMRLMLREPHDGVREATKRVVELALPGSEVLVWSESASDKMGMVDLLIVGWMTEDMRRFIEEMREVNPETKVVVYTSDDSLSGLVEEEVADLVLSKPYTKKVLEENLKSLVDEQ